MPVNFGGPGVLPSLGYLSSTQIGLQAGQTWLIPSGRWELKPGRYTTIQEFDPIAQFWRTIGSGSTTGSLERVVSDGSNYRLANQTGCAIGALITNAGSGYTSPPVVAASAGGSLWRAIVGGAISTTVTVTNGGSNYTYPPAVVFQAPPAGGLPATGYCTLSGGAVSSITVTDQGAGYQLPPTVVFINDAREGQNGVVAGFGAVATTALTGSGTITGLVCIDHGTPLTSLPTLTFTSSSGSSAAATVLMCWTITGYAVGTAGAGLSGTFAQITAYDALPTTAAAYANPSTQLGILKGRAANIKAPISAGGVAVIGSTGVLVDGGIYGAAPVPVVYANASVVTTAPVVTVTVGGNAGADVTVIEPT